MESLFDQLPTDDEIRRVIGVGFAALIHAYGKPIVITADMIDALPEKFTVTYQDTGRGREFSIGKDTENE